MDPDIAMRLPMEATLMESQLSLDGLRSSFLSVSTTQGNTTLPLQHSNLANPFSSFTATIPSVKPELNYAGGGNQSFLPPMNVYSRSSVTEPLLASGLLPTADAPSSFNLDAKPFGNPGARVFEPDLNMSSDPFLLNSGISTQYLGGNADFPQLNHINPLPDLISAAERPHPLGGVCTGPGCGRTHSISWQRPSAPIPGIPLTQEMIHQYARNEMYFCWHCCAMYTLQHMDGVSSQPLACPVTSSSGNPSLENAFLLGDAKPSKRAKTRYKCPACLQRDGEFKYFGLSVRLCKACYQLWSHHDGYRQQHEETMLRHIETCLKNPDSKRRLRVIYDLHVAAANKQKTDATSSFEVATIAVSGCFNLCRFLASVVHDVVSKYPTMQVEISNANFNHTSEKSRCVLIFHGNTLQVKPALTQMQDLCNLLSRCNVRIFEGKEVSVYASSSSSEDSSSSRDINRKLAQSFSNKASEPTTRSSSTFPTGGLSSGETICTGYEESDGSKSQSNHKSDIARFSGEESCRSSDGPTTSSPASDSSSMIVETRKLRFRGEIFDNGFLHLLISALKAKQILFEVTSLRLRLPPAFLHEVDVSISGRPEQLEPLKQLLAETASWLSVSISEDSTST